MMLISRRTLQDVRSMVRILRSAGRDGMDQDDPARAASLAAVPELADTTAHSTGIAITAHLDLDPAELSPPVDAAAYRVVQEALTNVVRHSGALRAEVSALVRDETLHIRMPTMDWLTATGRIVEDPHLAGVHVVVLATFDADENILRAVRAGAAGYLLKDISPADLRRAVRIVASGEALLAPAVTGRVLAELAGRLDHPTVPTLLDALTERERGVLGRVALGESNDEIGASLHISPATARTYVSRLLVKLHARDRTQLVVLAYGSGLVVPGRRERVS